MTTNTNMVLFGIFILSFLFLFLFINILFFLIIEIQHKLCRLVEKICFENNLDKMKKFIEYIDYLWLDERHIKLVYCLKVLIIKFIKYNSRQKCCLRGD